MVSFTGLGWGWDSEAVANCGDAGFIVCDHLFEDLAAQGEHSGF